MTDARIPERYLMDRRIVRLTDTQRSSYFMSTLWSVSNRTDGYFDAADLPLIPTFNQSAVDALVACGLWEATGDGWVDVEFVKVQTSRDDLEVLENARRADREKKARLRAHKAGNHELCTPDTCDSGNSPSFSPTHRDSPRDMSPGGHRTGKERQGQASNDEQTNDENPHGCITCGVVDQATTVGSDLCVEHMQQKNRADGWATRIPGTENWANSDSSSGLSCMTHGLDCDLQAADCEWSYA